MRSLLSLPLVMLIAACSTAPMSSEPSLAPRAAEAVDPRVPIPDAVPTGSVDPALAAQLQSLVDIVRAGTPQFETQEAEAARLARSAGPMASESWVVAQQALSRLVEQYGVTTRASGDIDAIAGGQLANKQWIRPADREAIAAAAAEVGAISSAQAAAIDRLTGQLAR